MELLRVIVEQERALRLILDLATRFDSERTPAQRLVNIRFVADNAIPKSTDELKPK